MQQENVQRTEKCPHCFGPNIEHNIGFDVYIDNNDVIYEYQHVCLDCGYIVAVHQQHGT